MTIPLFRFPYIVQKLIILQISMTEVFEAAVAFKAFARLVQSVNYQSDLINWRISKDGEEDDYVGFFCIEKLQTTLDIHYNRTIEFFNKIGNAYEDSNERMEAISSFVISLFKPKEFSVYFERNVENFKNLPFWKYSQKFHSISIYNLRGEGIEMSIDDMKLLFEEKEAVCYYIESKCPVNYNGPIKCESLEVSKFFEWVDVTHLLSKNCQVEELCFSEHPKNFTKIDAAKAWLNDGDIVLREMHIRGVPQQEEVDEIIRQLNATPSVLSKEELGEQCGLINCKAWDIMRDDGRRVSFHDHSFIFSLYFSS